jgi:hypothetical protein
MGSDPCGILTPGVYRGTPDPAGGVPAFYSFFSSSSSSK